MSQFPELGQSVVDLQAISLRLNRALQPQGIKAAVVYQVSRLQIALESLDAPERDRLSQQVLQIVRDLRVPIKTVELSAYRPGESIPIWQQRLRVSDGQVLTVPAVALPSPLVEPPIAAPLPSKTLPTNHWQDKSTVAIVAAAQRGDITAIQAYAQAVMAPYGMAPAQTQLQNGVLQLTIESAQYLGGPAFANELATALLPIQSDRVQVLEIYKRKFAGAPQLLIQKLDLSPALVAERLDGVPDRLSQDCPIGIKLIAGLYVAVGILHLGLALAMAIMLYSFATSAHKLPNVSIMFPYISSTLLLAIAVAAGSGVVAIGLWERRRWGLLLSYLLTGLMLFRGGQLLIDTWGTSSLIIPIEMMLMGLLIVMLVYLTRQPVTRQFR
jgi:hypothetical protein